MGLNFSLWKNRPDHPDPLATQRSNASYDPFLIWGHLITKIGSKEFSHKDVTQIQRNEYKVFVMAKDL